MHRITAALLACLISISIFSQQSALPRSTPEAEGVSSKSILSFLKAIDTGKHEFHSFMFLRHGKVIAEGWWKPYRADLKHTLYSTSKSFTSTAIGFAIQDNLVRLDEKVVSIFPDKLPDTVPANLEALTVQDLLTMEVGHDTDPTFNISTRETDWIKAFLAYPIPHQPGTRFVYNSLSTYLLSAIVQKKTGMRTIDYLGKKLFTPLSIEGMDWENDPQGINVGGWGLRLKTEDIAKLGQLYLQKGKWNGQQLLPESWIAEAATSKTEQGPSWTAGLNRDSSDWMQGYGFQFWRCRNNAYRADGAFGQYIIIMPDQDAVIAITSETPDMQGQINLVWEHLLPAMQNKTLPADKKTLGMLKSKLSALEVPIKKSSASRSSITKTRYRMDENPLHLQYIELNGIGKDVQATFHTDSARYSYVFGNGAWKNGETEKVGPSLLAAALTDMPAKKPFLVSGYYYRPDESSLRCVLQYIQSPHSQRWSFRMNGDKLEAQLSNSNAPGDVLTLTGTKQ